MDVYTNQGGHWSWVNDGMTDASGAYSVTALPAGSYGVEFGPMASGTAAAYITEYYNDKATLSTANQVPVAAGAVVSGINAALALGGRFTGTITAGDGGAPLANVDVYVTGSQGYYASGYTNSSGVYITTGLPTGSYLLQFSTNYTYGAAQDYISEYYNNKPTLATADPVALSAPGQSVVNAVLARGGAISGTVTSSLTGKPLPGVTVTVLDGSGNTVKQTYTDAIGNYLARGLPTGVYRVRFTLTVSCSLIKYEIYYNQKPSLNTADPVSVTAPAVTSNINGMLPVPETINLSFCFLPLVYR